MKAISLWQPWASLMAIGAKTIETRSWPLPARFSGPLVICSTAKWETKVLELLTLAMRSCNDDEDDWRRIVDSLRKSQQYVTLGDLPLGSALCIVQCLGCRRTKDIRSQISEDERAFGDYCDGRFGWMTDKGQLRRFETPIPVKGKRIAAQVRVLATPPDEPPAAPTPVRTPPRPPDDRLRAMTRQIHRIEQENYALRECLANWHLAAERE